MKTVNNFSLKTPVKLVIDYEEMQKVYHLLDNWGLEFQWYHCVERKIAVDGTGTIEYHLSHFVVPNQICQGKEVESDPMMQVKVYQEVSEQFPGDQAAVNDVISTLGCWCHSHVNAKVLPSPQDETQWKQLIEQHCQGGQNPNPVVMLIINKRRELFTRIFDPETGLTFEGVQLVVEYPNVDLSYAVAALESKLKKKPRPTPPKKPTVPSRPNTGQQYSWDSATSPKGGNYGGGSKALREQLGKLPLVGGGWGSNPGPKATSATEMAALLSNEDSEIIELVAAINSHPASSQKSQKAIEDLLALLQSELDDNMWDALHAMVFGSDSDVRKLQDTVVEKDEEADELARIQFAQSLADQVIDPPELVEEALGAVDLIYAIVEGMRAGKLTSIDTLESALEDFVAERGAMMLMQDIRSAK